MQSGSLSSCVRRTRSRAGRIRTRIRYSIHHDDRISGFILLLGADFVGFFRFDYYSFLLQWTTREGISGCDTHISSFKTKREGLVGPQGFEPRTKGL
jgi:hypothetical protein